MVSEKKKKKMHVFSILPKIVYKLIISLSQFRALASYPSFLKLYPEQSFTNASSPLHKASKNNKARSPKLRNRLIAALGLLLIDLIVRIKLSAHLIPSQTHNWFVTSFPDAKLSPKQTNSSLSKINWPVVLAHSL